MGGFAWVTLATNDSYSLGALVLAHSLRRVGTKHDLAVLVTPGVTASMREKLSSVFSLVREVNVLDSKDEANLALLARPELGITFTKLHCWRLTQYEKCVFVDADALVVKNCDELFDREELSAAPDVGWPDCFNSGVFVFKPSQETFASLTSFAAEKGSFDGGDQGLLNQYFSDWSRKDISKHLPFVYNMCSTATYSYLPAFKRFGEDARIIHFIGVTKPWLQYFDTITGQVNPAPGNNHLQPLLQLWWNIFCQNVHRQLSPTMASSTLAQHWHEKNPDSSLSNRPDERPTRDREDSTRENNVQPDFSEFHDPWENYREPLGEPERAIESPLESLRNRDEASLENRAEEGRVPAVELSPGENDKEASRYTGDLFPKLVCRAVTDSGGEPIRERENSRESDDVEGRTIKYILEIGGEDRRDRPSLEPDDQRKDVFCGQERRLDERAHLLRLHHHHHHQPHPTSHLPHVQRQIVLEINSTNRERRSAEEEERADRLERGCLLDTYDQRTTDSENGPSPSFPPAPCQNSQTVTTHSEMNVTRQLETNDAGIAGALAKITLGEARSLEQLAFEEHLRKQSWEQGQIDYMGRDSFENIWKKISETLSVQSPRQRQPSPPRTPPKSEKPDVEKPTEETRATEEKTEASSVADPMSEGAAAEEEEEEEVRTRGEDGETKRSSRMEVAGDAEKLEKRGSESSVSSSEPAAGDAAIATVASMPETKESPAQETRVPIRVARSVLETDVEESVSEDSGPVTEEAVSSAVSPTARESVPAVSETAIEASIPPAASGSNGIGNGIDAGLPSPRSRLESSVVPIAVAERPIDAPIGENVDRPEERVPSVPATETTASDTEENISSPAELSAKTTETASKSSEAAPLACPVKPARKLETLSVEKRRDDAAAGSTEESSREEPRIPATPTVTEPTPPTSPPTEGGAEGLEEPTVAAAAAAAAAKLPAGKKVVKKTVKKSTSEPNEPDSEAKGRVAKKTVKKVVKKKGTEEAEEEEEAAAVGGESSGGNEKAKRTVKVVKKTTKTSQTLETDASVPDTPPPPAGVSQVPVPPKRKLKTTSAKTTQKKDSEP